MAGPGRLRRCGAEDPGTATAAGLHRPRVLQRGIDTVERHDPGQLAQMTRRERALGNRLGSGDDRPNRQRNAQARWRLARTIHRSREFRCPPAPSTVHTNHSPKLRGSGVNRPAAPRYPPPPPLQPVSAHVAAAWPGSHRVIRPSGPTFASAALVRTGRAGRRTARQLTAAGSAVDWDKDSFFGRDGLLTETGVHRTPRSGSPPRERLRRRGHAGRPARRRGRARPLGAKWRAANFRGGSPGRPAYTIAG